MCNFSRWRVVQRFGFVLAEAACQKPRQASRQPMCTEVGYEYHLSHINRYAGEIRRAGARQNAQPLYR